MADKHRFVLDTNIVSETLKAQPDTKVLAWLLQHQEDLYLNTITIAELFYGAYRLPYGKRRESLLYAIERISTGYESRILAFDARAAQEYGRLQEVSRNAGYMLTVEDGMIAAICIVSNTTLATRNTEDFLHLGVELCNPFEELTPDVVEVTLK